jgi:hypothetical protein
LRPQPSTYIMVLATGRPRTLRTATDETMKPTSLLLLVALTWASFGFSAPARQQPPSSAPVWRQSQETDAAGGTTYTRFTLVGKFLTSPQDEVSSRPALVVDCIPGKGAHSPKGRFLAGSLLVGTTLKIVYVEPEEIHGTSYFPKVAVRYRTDDAKEEEENWSPGTEKTSASIDKDSLKKILRARTVAISADDDRGSQVAMKFDMPNPTLVEEGCSVDRYKR